MIVTGAQLFQRKSNYTEPADDGNCRFVVPGRFCRIGGLGDVPKTERNSITDRFGVAKVHPASVAFKSENGNFSRLYRLLALET